MVCREALLETGRISEYSILVVDIREDLEELIIVVCVGVFTGPPTLFLPIGCYSAHGVILQHRWSLALALAISLKQRLEVELEDLSDNIDEEQTEESKQRDVPVNSVVTVSLPKL